MQNIGLPDHDRYYSFFTHSRELIYICDKDGRLIDINPAGVSLLGYVDKNEILGSQLASFYMNSDDWEYYTKQMKEKGYVKDFELILKKKNGDKCFCLETAHMIKLKNSRVLEYRGIIKDNTQYVKNELHAMKMNLELIDINKKLKQTQTQLINNEKLAAVGQLAAGVAHEINNPLGFIYSNFETLHNYMKAITGYFDQFKQEINNSQNTLTIASLSELTDKLKNQMRIPFILQDITTLFEESKIGFERIFEIINSLMNFTRIDKELKIEEFDLNRLIEETLLIVRNEIKYVFQVKKEFSTLPFLKGYRNEINQVLLNIIMNAIQAVKSMEKKKQWQLLIKTYMKDEYVFCSIADNGPGISKEILNKIFDPFFTTKDVNKGTGLGLSISYNIILKHKGDISVESEIGKGTNFIIKLPIYCELKEH